MTGRGQGCVPRVCSSMAAVEWGRLGLSRGPSERERQERMVVAAVRRQAHGDGEMVVDRSGV